MVETGVECLTLTPNNEVLDQAEGSLAVIAEYNVGVELATGTSGNPSLADATAVAGSADIVEADGKTLRKRPKPPALHPNERVGQGDGTDIAFARPSSRHSGGFNVAYVGQNVQFIRDTIDYYVWAKLMTSSDTDLMLPGTRAPIAGLGDVRLTDEQINP